MIILPLNTILLLLVTAICFFYGIYYYKKISAALEVLLLTGASLIVGISNTVIYKNAPNIESFNIIYNQIVSCYLLIEMLCIIIFFKRTFDKKIIKNISDVLMLFFLVLFIIMMLNRKNIVRDFYFEFNLIELLLVNFYYFLFFLHQINNPDLKTPDWRNYFSNGLLIFINISAPAYFINSIIINQSLKVEQLLNFTNDLAYIILFSFTLKSFTCLKKGI